MAVTHLARPRMSLVVLPAVLALAVAPRPARALRLLDQELSLELDGSEPAPLLVALAAAPPPGDLDFDLLGKPKPPPPTTEEDKRMKKRRTYLDWHQKIGLAMFGLETATVVVGQLNYSDKFGTANTGKYVLPHQVLAYTTFAAFATAGTLALLAPRPKDKPDRGWDRVRVHKIFMALSTLGMLAQAYYGIQTRNREGYLNQQQIAKTHLIIGYGTLAATGVAVGAIVF